MKRGGEARKVIVVRRKARHHDEHHGGSWKVAYADFVTAMMAFFLVMWIMGMDAGVKDLVQGYFADPAQYRATGEPGAAEGGAGRPIHLGIRPLPRLSFEEQRSSFERVAVVLSRRLGNAASLRGLDAATEVIVTDQGLRIELMDTGDGRGLFDRGSAAIRPGLRELVTIIASELAPLPNGIILEGHTDARPFGSGRYSNWELSVDRANAARRALLDGGLVEEHRILEVRGHAAGRPRVPDDPLNPRNRRISLLLPYTDGPDLRPLAGSAIPAAPGPASPGLP